MVNNRGMPRDPNRRQTILTAAERLFLRYGYDAVTVDSLCEETGSSKGSFYHFFSSKEDLAIEMVGDVWRQTQSRMAETFAPAVPPLERIREELVHTTRPGPGKQLTGCPIGALAASLGRHARVRRRLSFAFNHMRQYYVDAFREAIVSGDLDDHVDAEAMADLMLLTVQGIGVLSRATHSAPRIRRMVKNVLPQLTGRY